MLTFNKGLKGGRRRDHLRLVHKCLKPLVLYGSIACNVEIGVAGRKQSILQTTDGVMSHFSMMVKLPRNTTEAADAVLMATQFMFAISIVHMDLIENCPKTLAFMLLSGSESDVPKKMSMGSTIMQTLRNDSGYMERLVVARTSLHCRLPGFAVAGGEPGAGQCAEWLPEGTILQAIQIGAGPAVPHNLRTAACYLRKAKNTRIKDFPVNISCLKPVPPCSAYCQPRHNKLMQMWPSLTIIDFCHALYAGPQHPPSN